MSAKHAETIKKSTSLRTSARSFTPSPGPHVSAFDQTPSPRLCGRPLWTAPYWNENRWVFDLYWAIDDMCNDKLKCVLEEWSLGPETEDARSPNFRFVRRRPLVKCAVELEAEHGIAIIPCTCMKEKFLSGYYRWEGRFSRRYECEWEASVSVGDDVMWSLGPRPCIRQCVELKIGPVASITENRIGQNWSIVFIHFHVVLLSAWAIQKRSRLQHWYCVWVNTPKRYRQLWVKDLPKVLAWRLEWDSNLRPSGRKAPNPSIDPPRTTK